MASVVFQEKPVKLFTSPQFKLITRSQLFHNLCQLLLFPNFKTLLASNNASIIIPTTKSCFLIWSLSLGLTLWVWPWVCSKKAALRRVTKSYKEAFPSLHFPLIQLLFNLQRSLGCIAHNITSLLTNTAALGEKSSFRLASKATADSLCCSSSHNSRTGCWLYFIWKHMIPLPLQPWLYFSTSRASTDLVMFYIK